MTIRDAAGLSYGDKQALIRQALLAKFATDDDGGLYVEDFGDTWVVFYSYGGYQPGPGDWQVSYTITADGIVSLSGDPVQVVPKTSYLPTEAQAAIADLTHAVKELRSRTGTAVEVRSEPLTYRQDAPYSYYQDLVRAERRTASPQAEARLARHAAEMDVVNADREKRAAAALGEKVEVRVTPNQQQGQGGYFSPPAWLNQQFATAPRTGRVLAALMPTFDLPANVQAVNVPYIFPGNTAQAGPDNSPVPSNDWQDAYDGSAVVTIDGMTDLPLQLLEQSPAGAHLDWVLFTDLSEAYDQSLEYQLLNGTGTPTLAGPGNGQLLGVLNRTGALQVTWTTASPTDVAFYNQLGVAAARVGNNRRRPPEAWLMRTSRWAWMSASPDGASRPFVLPTSPTGKNLDSMGGQLVSDGLLGWPVYVDDQIPATFGAAANQDVAIALRPSDLLLLEGAPVTKVDRESDAGTLGVRLIYRRYVAAITGRRQSGIAIVAGTGMILPAAYTN